MEFSQKVPIFKEFLIENSIDFEQILQLENLILNKISWNIDMLTPNEICLLFIKDLNSSENFNKFLNSNFHSCLLQILEYSFSVWDIYLRFDLYIITFSCLFITLEFSEDNHWVPSGFYEYFSDEDLNSIANCCFFLKQEFIKSDESNIHKTFPNNYYSDSFLNKQRLNISNHENNNNIDFTYKCNDNLKCIDSHPSNLLNNIISQLIPINEEIGLIENYRDKENFVDFYKENFENYCNEIHLNNKSQDGLDNIDEDQIYKFKRNYYFNKKIVENNFQSINQNLEILSNNNYFNENKENFQPVYGNEDKFIIVSKSKNELNNQVGFIQKNPNYINVEDVNESYNKNRNKKSNIFIIN